MYYTALYIYIKFGLILSMFDKPISNFKGIAFHGNLIRAMQKHCSMLSPNTLYLLFQATSKQLVGQDRLRCTSPDTHALHPSSLAALCETTDYSTEGEFTLATVL